MEAVRNYLITKKTSKKDNHDKTHNAKPLPDLIQGQEILFLSPADPNQYIEGTVIAKAQQPRSYLLELQGKTYHRTHQHIHPLTNPIIPRPSMPEQQNTTSSRPSASQQHKPTISGPSMSEHQNTTISRPSASQQHKTTILGLSTSEHQNTTISRPSAPQQHKPTISGPSTPKPIPAPCRKFLTRPIQPTTATLTLDDVMAHLNAINQPSTKETVPEPESVPADQIIESNISSPTTSPTTESESEDSTESTTTSDDNQSTTSDNSLA